jgi:hypothetical protein|tara:strand:- start:128 stop:358 length:231 start_codon:yes stop_codon:yes gene_type:complete
MENKEFIKVEENKDLSRDVYSGGIVNTNRSAYEKAIARSKLVKMQRDELKNATKEINNLQDEMREIKILLQQLVNK